MIAYNQKDIHNLTVLKKAKQWFANKLLSAEQMKLSIEKYSTAFYDPNIFIKIGLFIFTFFVILSSLGLYTLLFSPIVSYSTGGGDSYWFISCIIFSVGCIVALELLIKAKMLYQSGIDDALLYSSIAFLYSGLLVSISSYNEDYSYNQNETLITLILLLPFTIAGAIRYIDTVLSILSLILLYAISFLLLIKIGDIAKMIMPFFMMSLSAIIYIIVIKCKKRSAFLVWTNCLKCIEVISMLIFYFACNYFVIRESSVVFFNLELMKGEQIPMAWIFYILTAVVPLLYIYHGLTRKNKISLWSGLILLALSVLTFKYYFSLGHPEITLTVAGLIMIIVSYFSIKYFKTDKHGLTYKEELDENSFLKSQAEALALVQTFGQQPTSINKTENFGGGEFGGAGSGGNF